MYQLSCLNRVSSTLKYSKANMYLMCNLLVDRIRYNSIHVTLDIILLYITLKCMDIIHLSFWIITSCQYFIIWWVLLAIASWFLTSWGTSIFIMHTYILYSESDLPINAFGIVILSHIRSLISSPESGCAMALTIVAMSVFTVKWGLSSKPARKKRQICVMKICNRNILLIESEENYDVSRIK